MKCNFVASWRPDASKFYKNTDPQKVAEEIFAIGDNPQTKEILDMARDPTTETHKCIEWDDTEAAEKYRLHQVRLIQHDLQVVAIGLNEKKPIKKLDIPVRMFYNLDGESGYRATPIIVKDEDLHLKLLKTARNELEEFIRKYSILSELKPLLDEIERKIVELKVFDKVS